MKYFIIICGLVLLIVGGLGMAKSQQMENLELTSTGGTADFSDKNAPKKINSENITDFYFAFEDNFSQKFYYGQYIMKIEPAANGFEMSLSRINGKFSKASEGCFNKSKIIDASVLTELQKIVKEHDIASINGHRMRNSAFGSYMDLKIVYDSGETITAFAEGGATPMPRNFDGLWFLKFFADELNVDIWLPEEE